MTNNRKYDDNIKQRGGVMLKNGEEELKYTIKFIDAVKNGDFSEEGIQDIPINPRMDEPIFYGAEQNEDVYTSFCN